MLTRRAWLEIDLDKLNRNLECLRGRLNEGCSVMAVVKANGYGHGAVETARFLERKGVRIFGVAALDEAVELRNAGITSDIIILSYTDPCLAAQLIKYDIIQSAGDIAYAKSLNDYSLSSGSPVRVHIKVDTGMTRLGFDCNTDEEIETILWVYRNLNALKIEGIFSHYSSSDDSDEDGNEYTKLQFQRFERLLEKLRGHGIDVGARHICNSAGTQRYPQSQLDIVRCGALLDGYNLASHIDPWPIAPIASLKTSVTALRSVDPETPVSYSRTFVSAAPMKVATLSIGYADGYPRALSNRGRVIIRGQWAPQIGNVCMDQMMVDVTEIPDVAVGDTAVIIGQDGELTQDAADLAAQCGSCVHEIISRLGERLQRVYFENKVQTEVK